MAYFQGVAASVADIRTALINACVASGWGLSGDVLHKGGCYLQSTVSGGACHLRAGGGLGAGGVLQNPTPQAVRFGDVGPLMAMTFPCAYHIETYEEPDEVFLNISYGVDAWQWAAFGRSDLALPASGVWVAASAGQAEVRTVGVEPARGYGASGTFSSPGPFWGSGSSSGADNSYIHTGIDGVQWPAAKRTADNGSVSGSYVLAGLNDRSPSALNAAAPLFPAQIWQFRVGNTSTLVADIRNLRYLRIDNYAPGEVLVLGHDRWKIYPFFRKNAEVRDGGGSLDHSGTMGMAVRYSGS